MPREGGSHLAQTERLLYLRTADAFSELRARDLAALAEQTREVVFDPGEHLMREGTRCRTLHLIIDGRVRLEHAGVTIGLSGARAGVATLAMIAQRDAPMTAVAEVETMTLELAREPLMELLSDNFPMLNTILRMLARGLVRSRERLGPSAGYSDRPDEARECPLRPLDLVQRVRFLREAIPFARAQVAALVDLARYAEEIRLEPGRLLWRQGDVADWSDLLYCGTIRCETDGGRQQFSFGQGSAVGTLDNVALTPRWYSATSETAIVALRITAEHLLDLFEDRFEIAHAFLKMIAGELLDRLEERGVFEGLVSITDHDGLVVGGGRLEGA